MKRFLGWLFAGFLYSFGAQAITIGAGPVLQNSLGDTTDKAGNSWYEEFQDWGTGDLRALDPNADWMNTYLDGHDTARDIIAFYTHEDSSNYYFRIDLFNQFFGSPSGFLDLYVLIDINGTMGGRLTLPDGLPANADPAHPWELAIKVYDPVNFSVESSAGFTVNPSFLGSYWHGDLDAVEFGIERQQLIDHGWNGSSPLFFQVFCTKDFSGQLSDGFGTLTGGVLSGGVLSTDSAGRAKYALIAHANQSLDKKEGTQGHIYTATTNNPGFIRLLDTAEMFDIAVNLHISGTLLMSFQWATQDPTEMGYPDRDGPTFLNRVKDFVTTGPGSLMGGVLAEHIMPYYEGEVNEKSIQQNSELLQHMFGLSEADMKVMHVPERVIRSNTNSPHVNPAGPLDGKTFEEIESSGFVATVLDEVTHLHWWFYPNEQSNPGWDTSNCGRWAGGQGNDEEPYHHKVHKINGVYTFMINDREDQSKFGNDDGGMALDTRYTLLDKAQGDYAQITITFDDWEALAGNSFASSTPNNNASQIHNTLRWAANHPWIELVNLKDVATWAQSDPNWVIDQGYVYDKTMQTYEWLKRASEHTYDNWYYGKAGAEEDFFNRQPAVIWNGGGPWVPMGIKKYGDMNTPGTLMRDSWDTIQQITSPTLKKVAEWSYSAMIYETAWHDEDANPDQYKSRNYQDTTQGGFTRGVAQGNCDESFEDTTYDDTSGWALALHGHARDMGVLKAASDWIANVKNGTQGADTTVYAADIDDDTLWEYVLCNDKIFVCFERWGARLIKAFQYDPFLNGGDAREIVGVPACYPIREHENEGEDDNRCSVFKDRYNSGLNGGHYIDMDFASTAPVMGVDSWTFVSDDGNITKTITLPSGRDIVMADYQIDPTVGTLYSRHGLSPNQVDLMFNGPLNLNRITQSTYRGLKNSQGGEAYVVQGLNTEFVAGSIYKAGWEHRVMPLTEQFETFNNNTMFSIALAFSEATANDYDGDGLSNEDEMNIHGTQHTLADTDGDCMPDGWEVANNTNPNVADADDDKDSDGSTNLEEYIAGTDADDPNDVFTILSIQKELPDKAIISFPSAPNRIYQLWYNDQFPVTNTWNSGGTKTNQGTSTTETFTNQVPSNTRVYRLEVR